MKALFKKIAGNTAGAFVGLMAMGGVPHAAHAQSGNNDLAANTNAPTALRTSYNATATNDDGKTYTVTPDPEKSKPVVFYENGSEAIEYSNRFNGIVLAVNFNENIPPEKRERVYDYIVNTMFAGENEAPVAIFVGDDAGPGFLSTAYIEGRWQKSLDGTKFYNLDQLNERAPILAETWRLQNLGKPAQAYAPGPGEN